MYKLNLKRILIIVVIINVIAILSVLVLKSSSSKDQKLVKIIKDKPFGIEFTYVKPGVLKLTSESRLFNSNEVFKKINYPFLISKFEITEAQYSDISDTYCHAEHGNLPKTELQWNNADNFCKKFTQKLHDSGQLPEEYEVRLPTEAEWMYAASGGVKSKGYKYSGSNNCKEVAFCDGAAKSFDNTGWPVIKKPNELGVYDMSGSEVEWCLDKCKADNTKSLSSYLHILKGGSFEDAIEDCSIETWKWRGEDYSYTNKTVRPIIVRKNTVESLLQK